MIKKWWDKKTKEQKKWFLIKSISTVVFLLIGIVFGLIAITLNGFSFIEFIQQPTVILVLLVLLALLILNLSTGRGK